MIGACCLEHLINQLIYRFLAIDETDRMVERGHFEELHPLLERLNVDEERRGARQNFVFSATLTMVHDLPSHMKGKKVSDLITFFYFGGKMRYEPLFYNHDSEQTLFSTRPLDPSLHRLNR